MEELPVSFDDEMDISLEEFNKVWNAIHQGLWSPINNPRMQNLIQDFLDSDITVVWNEAEALKLKLEEDKKMAEVESKQKAAEEAKKMAVEEARQKAEAEAQKKADMESKKNENLKRIAFRQRSCSLSTLPALRAAIRPRVRIALDFREEALQKAEAQKKADMESKKNENLKKIALDFEVDENESEDSFDRMCDDQRSLQEKVMTTSSDKFKK